MTKYDIFKVSVLKCSWIEIFLQVHPYSVKLLWFNKNPVCMFLLLLVLDFKIQY